MGTMLWTVTICTRRIGRPSTPLTKRFVVSADNSHDAEQHVRAFLGVSAENVVSVRCDAHQDGIVRVR